MIVNYAIAKQRKREFSLLLCLTLSTLWELQLHSHEVTSKIYNGTSGITYLYTFTLAELVYSQIFVPEYDEKMKFAA